jgi:hypothetical protein
MGHPETMKWPVEWAKRSAAHQDYVPLGHPKLMKRFYRYAILPLIRAI